MAKHRNTQWSYTERTEYIASTIQCLQINPETGGTSLSRERINRRPLAIPLLPQTPEAFTTGETHGPAGPELSLGNCQITTALHCPRETASPTCTLPHPGSWYTEPSSDPMLSGSCEAPRQVLPAAPPAQPSQPGRRPCPSSHSPRKHVGSQAAHSELLSLQKAPENSR
jgi:hypothetical protein